MLLADIKKIAVSIARVYRPSFRENKPKTLVFGHFGCFCVLIVFAKTGSINSGTCLWGKLTYRFAFFVNDEVLEPFIIVVLFRS
jgi:hypothetical protein